MTTNATARAYLGAAMAAFFGGRAECRIRRMPIQIGYVDFTSMYPTVNALFDSWRLLTARRVGVKSVTRRVRTLLADPSLLEACFAPAAWRKFVTLVEIAPNGEILPVRARYDVNGADFGIGVNPYRLDGTAWYALADVIAATLLSGRAPKVVKAVEFVPTGRARAGLRSLHIGGQVLVDPAQDDLFRAFIEQRHRVRRDEALSEEMRERLSALLKVLANSTAYGILAQFDRQESEAPVASTVHAGTETFLADAQTPEDPGEFCFPPLAACLTAGARLMLALVERCVTDAGGTYAFCDTDSMGIVVNEGRPPECAAAGISRRHLDTIVNRFASLNPYNTAVIGGSILRVEAENFDAAGAHRSLFCWALSAKRYVLYALDGNGEPELVKWSEHGLGHLLDPSGGDDEDWIATAWMFLLRRELGLAVKAPAWLDLPAVSRITASSVGVLAWFRSLNIRRAYADQIKPANFLLLAQADPLGGDDVLPVAPYEASPSRWLELPWLDGRTGDRVRVTTARIDGVARGAVRVCTYDDILERYLGHPEAKSLAADGMPVRADTRGLLQRRPVHGVLPAIYVGKEGNRLEERMVGLIPDDESYANTYGDLDHADWARLVRPVLATLPRDEFAARTGLHVRSVERLVTGASTPTPENEERLGAIALDVATAGLGALGATVPADRRGRLYLYARRAAGVSRTCACGNELSGRQRYHCSDACRKRTARHQVVEISGASSPANQRSNA